MKRGTYIFLVYYFVVITSEYLVESSFYNFEADNWNFIIWSEVIFSALMVVPVPIFVTFRLLQDDTAHATNLLPHKYWLVTLLVFSLIAMFAVPSLSYQRMLATKIRYDSIIDGQ